MSHNPNPTNTHGLLQPDRFRLLPVRSPLLRESPLISFPPGTEMFHFPGFASPLKREDNPGLPGLGFPIRASRDQRLLAPPPGFSQLATPFIATRHRGIHQTPLLPSKPFPTKFSNSVKNFIPKKGILIIQSFFPFFKHQSLLASNQLFPTPIFTSSGTFKL